MNAKTTLQASRPRPAANLDPSCEASEPDLHGATIVDEYGVETPITEHMVQQALDTLDGVWRRERERRLSRQD